MISRYMYLRADFDEQPCTQAKKWLDLQNWVDWQILARFDDLKLTDP